MTLLIIPTESLSQQISNTKIVESSTKEIRKSKKLPDGVYRVLRADDNKKDLKPLKEDELVVNANRFFKKSADMLYVINPAFSVPFRLEAIPDKKIQEDGKAELKILLNKTAEKALKEFSTEHLGSEVVIVIGGSVVAKQQLKAVIQDGQLCVPDCSDGGGEYIYFELQDNVDK